MKQSAGISGFGRASTLIRNSFSLISVGKRDWITGNISLATFGAASAGRSRSRPTICRLILSHSATLRLRGLFLRNGNEGIRRADTADGTLARLGRNEGVRKMVTAERKAVVGSPDLESLTTSHIERVFLTVRQELKRFQRKGLGYSKDLETHKAAVALPWAFTTSFGNTRRLELRQRSRQASNWNVGI